MFKNLPKNRFFLAPLAGFSDAAFRLLCQKQGAGLTFSELTSIDYVFSKKSDDVEGLFRFSDERVVGLQLFGSSPKKVKDSLSFVEDKFDFFDFNAGCPSNNILRQGAGADLLSRPKSLFKMLDAIISNTNKPVTLKYRLGLNEKKENFLDIAKSAQDLGVGMLTLHARYVSQGYSGRAYWDKIRLLKEKVSVPVTGNGDVRSPEDARRMFDFTGCDYLMVGRWAMGNPFCFKQLNDYFKSGKYESVCASKRLKGFLDYFILAKKCGISFPRLKIQAMQFCKDFHGSKDLRRSIAFAKCNEQIINIINDFLSK